ncbi:phage major tail tube protein [Sphingomonas sp. PR090111-T3T-6A]|uniref:phage major tail tube protein n=1 Tax=Sphingomonas sp. PR090111-T3T-6A TaxID=685778 RepID=UPI000361E403|nr:phage major tail tube protein [Sphingomonas sp. PR090111-T3T-6A]
MATLPSKLKKMLVGVNGQPFAGEASTVKLPVLSRDMEEYKGGGLLGPVKWDKGMKAIDLEHEYGGFVPALFSGFGSPTVDSEMVRFIGAYQSDTAGGYDSVEILVRGRHEEIDMGDAKAGDDTKQTVKTSCSYYRLSVNRRVLVEIDFLATICIIDGVDRAAELREALLLA